jgi:hypothetical protein
MPLPEQLAFANSDGPDQIPGYFDMTALGEKLRCPPPLAAATAND